MIRHTGTRERSALLLDSDTRYTVAGYGGVAWWYDRDETEPDEDTEWSGYESPTGRVLIVMIGDDRRYAVDPADCTPLAEDGYCPECGQTGCMAYR